MKLRPLIYAGTAVAVALAIGWLIEDGGDPVDPVRPDLAGRALAGEAAFETWCAACHGENARGTDEGPPLVHLVYEPSHHGDAAFLLAARQGVRQHHWRYGDMPPVPGVGDAELTDIVAYVRAMQRANGIE